MKQRRNIPVSHIFFQYILLGKRLLEHFRISYILKSLLSGNQIAPVKKLQHPLISYQTPPLNELWKFLKDNFV